jgi:hypothetical protein
MESLIDQRRVPRLSVTFPVKISNDIEATVTDVSETGIGFECSGAASPIEQIPIFTEVSSTSMATSENIPVKLIWYKDSVENRYQFGACFFSAVALSQLFTQLK